MLKLFDPVFHIVPPELNFEQAGMASLWEYPIRISEKIYEQISQHKEKRQA